MFRKFAYFIFCKLLYRVNFIGTENIKDNEAILYVANHVRGQDPIFIWLKVKNLNIMAKEELFKSKIMAAILKKCGVFPIARGKKDFSHVLQAVKVLKNKNSLLIFPEGTRNARLKNVKAKNGAVYVAASANAKIVPVHISEKYSLFKKLDIEFKEAIDLNIPKEDIKNKQVLNAETERIMNIIYGR